MSIRDWFAAAVGRPRAIQGEQMVVADGLLASMIRPGQGGVYFLPVDEIIRRHGWRTYQEMRHDDQVKAVLAFKRILVAGRTWDLKPANNEPQSAEVAKFVDWALRRIDLDSIFNETMTAFEFGYALGEKVFERANYNGKQVVTIKKVAFRDPEQIELSMDNHGNWTGARQTAQGLNIDLGPDKLFLYSHNARFGNIYGESDLRSAYRSWWAKKFIINFWNVYLERMGSPMTKMTYPQGASEELKETLKRILKNLASKTEIIVPQGVEIDLIEAQRSGNATYKEALDFHNNGIARALLMVSLLGTGGENNIQQGSQSQSSLQLRILFKMADGIAQNMQREFMRQVVKQIVAFNFDGDPEAIMPRFIWQDYGQFEGMKVADTIRLLFAAGILDMDQEDVNYARSVLGLPIRGEGDKPDEVTRPQALPPPANPNAPPPPANQGNERAKKGGDNENPNPDNNNE